MGKSQRANMAITTAGDRLRKQRLTRQERQFSVNRGAEKIGIFPIYSAKSQHKQCRPMSFHVNASSSALASWRSAVSKPSVNQP
jgi:hypothetical protein